MHKISIFSSHPLPNDNAARTRVHRNRLFPKGVLVVLASAGTVRFVQPRAALFQRAYPFPSSTLTFFLSRIALMPTYGQVIPSASCPFRLSCWQSSAGAGSALDPHGPARSNYIAFTNSSTHCPPQVGLLHCANNFYNLAPKCCRALAHAAL